MNLKIEPSTLKGEISASPSKSYAHRLLICSALAKGCSDVFGISQSDDMNATLGCMAALGAEIKREGSNVFVRGIEKRSRDIPVLDCNESGSTLRFFIPISLLFSTKTVFKGSARLMERGVGIYEDMLKESGVVFEKQSDSITVTGCLKAGNYVMRGDISSQFASGMLFSLPLVEGDSTLTVKSPVESRSYIDITLDALKSFGIEIEENPENTFHIKGSQGYSPKDITVEGDWSNAAFLYGFNATGADINIKGLNEKSIQGDKVCKDMFEMLDKENAAIDISDCPDLGPVLFAVAAAKKGGHFTGIRRLKIKESDRAAAMAKELSKFGVECEIHENDMLISTHGIYPPNEALYGHNDHRIVMSLCILLALTGGEIEGAEAVRKSWPAFFEEMEKLGLRIKQK